MADNTTPRDGHDLAAVEALLRSLSAEDLTPAVPPASIWTNIQAELASDPVAVADDDITSTTVGATSTTSITTITTISTTPTPPPRGMADVVRIDARPRFSRSMLAAAAAAVLIVGGAIAVAATRGGDTADVVAVATLAHNPSDPGFDPLGIGSAATARLVQGDAGYEIVLTDTKLPGNVLETADFELWLISKDPATGEISDVQPVDKLAGAGGGTYRVPAGLDPATYSTVDISIEPRDGDEQHSGHSILRGPLEEV